MASSALRVRFPLLAALALLATCKEDRSITGADRAWVTPLGSLTANPPVVFAGAGDIADCDGHDQETATLLDGIEGTVFTAGDNAYPHGTDTQFQNCYDPTWGRHKARTHPSVGNRDYDTQGAAGYYNYFGAAAGERGKGFYSYDLGDWHIVVVNNYISMSATSEQGTWLRADLTATTKPCKLAYYHEPLYSSATGTGSGGTTLSSIKPLFTMLYDAGVDVVLNGHRHFYERLAPMNPNGNLDTERGVREFIVGTGGASIGDPTNVHPRSEVRFGSGNYGVLKLYLYADSYAWRFIPVPGRTLSDTGSTVCHGAASGVDPSLSTVGAAPTSIEAGGAASTVTVTVKDDGGAPISGATVVLAATGSGNTLAQPASPTDANGVATGTLSSTVAETKTVTARVGFTTITQTAQVTVTPGPLSAEQSTVTASPGLIALGVGTSTITVTAKDANGNPISGATVVLAATGSGNTLTQPPGPTNASGVATGTLSSTVEETKTVSATANGTALAQTATVTVTTQGFATITHSLLTAGNNPVNQAVYTTASISPAPNTLVTVAVLGQNSQKTPVIPTLSGGGMTAWTQVVSVTFDTGTLPLRRLTIFRALSAAPGSGPITITSGMTLSHCQWIVSQWGGVETSGVNGAEAIAQTGSNRGDGVSGLTVPLAAFGNPNNVAYGVFGVRSSVAAVTPGAGFTEISEQPSGEGTPGDLQAEWATNRNTIAATWTALNAGALGVELRAAGSGAAPVVDAAQSTVAAAPSAIQAGSGSSTMTVTVKDGGANPISGASVVLAATGSGNTLTQPAGPTNASGVATGTLSSTVAGAKTVSATANGTALAQTAQVTVTAGPLSASASTVSAAPSVISVSSGTSTITVRVTDANGNPISGVAVALAATGSGNTLTQPTAPTNANGVATGTLSSAVAETKTVSATANGTALTQIATVAVTASGSGTITHALLTAGNNAANQSVYTTAAIAPAPNTLITVAVLGHNSSSAPPSPTLSGGGMTAWTEVVSTTFDTGTLPLKRLTIFRALSGAPGSGALTITFSKTVSNCQWIVSQWSGVETSGVNGAGAIVQTGSNQGDAASGLTVPLAAFGNPNNVAYGVFGVRSSVVAVTPGAGFTEISEQPSAEGTTADLEAEWAANRNTITATWTNLNAGALGVELKARTAP